MGLSEAQLRGLREGRAKYKAQCAERRREKAETARREAAEAKAAAKLAAEEERKKAMSGDNKTRLQYLQNIVCKTEARLAKADIADNQFNTLAKLQMDALKQIDELRKADGLPPEEKKEEVEETQKTALSEFEKRLNERRRA